MSMARKIITLCDPHLTEHDEEVPGEPYRLGVETPGGKWVWIEIDLCESDAAEMAQFSAWLDKYGRAFEGPDGVARKRGPYKKAARPERPDAASPEPSQVFKCPACETEYTARSSLSSHARRTHGKSLAELMGEDLPFKCPDCGKAFSRSQSLGVHRKRKHGDAS